MKANTWLRWTCVHRRESRIYHPKWRVWSRVCEPKSVVLVCFLQCVDVFRAILIFFYFVIFFRETKRASVHSLRNVFDHESSRCCGCSCRSSPSRQPCSTGIFQVSLTKPLLLFYYYHFVWEKRRNCLGLILQVCRASSRSSNTHLCNKGGGGRGGGRFVWADLSVLPFFLVVVFFLRFFVRIALQREASCLDQGRWGPHVTLQPH